MCWVDYFRLSKEVSLKFLGICVSLNLALIVHHIKSFQFILMPSCINEAVSLLGYNWVVKFINFIHLAIPKMSLAIFFTRIT